MRPDLASAVKLMAANRPLMPGDGRQDVCVP